VIEEVLKKPRLVETDRIGVPFTILAALRNPIPRFTAVEHLEQARRIEIGSARVIQNSKFVAFDSYNDIRLPERQIPIPCIPPSQFDYHR